MSSAPHPQLPCPTWSSPPAWGVGRPADGHGPLQSQRLPAEGAARRSPSLWGSARGWRRTKLGELSEEGAERGGEQDAAARPSCEAALCRGR